MLRVVVEDLDEGLRPAQGEEDELRLRVVEQQQVDRVGHVGKETRVGPAEQGKIKDKIGILGQRSLVKSGILIRIKN